MQFSTIISVLSAAVAVNAAPGTPVQERQATPTIYAQFFSGGGCQGIWLDDTVFVQSNTNCVNNDITTGYQSTNFTGNTATKSLKVYSLRDCNESGNSFVLAPGHNSCFAQNIGSAKFI